MIDKALHFLEDQLNAVLSQAGQPDNLLLTSVVNEKGELHIQAGQLALTVVNIEEEKILKAQLPNERRNGNQIQFSNPEIKLNLLLLLAANPGNNNYLAALERLSQAMLFLQGTPFFDRTRFPALAAPPEIEKLSIELYTLTLEQQNQLWASLGAKYLPSVVYKLRLVIIDRGLFGNETPAIRVLENELKRIN